MTKRKNIPRKENGKLEYIPEGLDKFADDVAIRLLEEFPTIDYIDLMSLFECNFRYSLSRAFARETIEG